MLSYIENVAFEKKMPSDFHKLTSDLLLSDSCTCVAFQYNLGDLRII